MTTKFTPPSVIRFLGEYEALCRKHNLMVFSDGESVEVDEADENLWGINESTEYWWRKTASQSCPPPPLAKKNPKRQGFVTSSRPPQRLVDDLASGVDSMREIAESYADRPLTQFEKWMVDHLTRLKFEVRLIKKKLKMPNY